MADVLKFVLDGSVECVEVDPERGPLILMVDGSTSFMHLRNMRQGQKTAIRMPEKTWKQMTSSERETLARMAAKKNKGMREWKGAEFWKKPEEERLDPAAVEQLMRKRMTERCAAERERATVVWTPIWLDQVTNGHDKRAPGMIYGLEFPWTEAMLADFGPKWLTEAFRAAGTLDQTNKVKSIVLEKKIKITAGNNAGKFLFEVVYARPDPCLHTKLFAKVPFAMTPQTKSDRLSSSVYKQPMDLCEINTYRLFEASLPMKTPKYYYGDISNETSNFILITERIPYAEIHGRAPQRLQPYVIEGPYDKCMDCQLRSPVKDYYMLLMDMTGRIAAAHKTGRLGSAELVESNLTKPAGGPDNPAAYGFNPQGGSGEAPKTYKRKLETAISFFSNTARVCYPEYCSELWWHEKLVNTMLTWSAYQGEIEFFKVLDWSYVAVGHNNMNIDNAYFWRDSEGTLDCGLIDWGGFGSSNLGHKVYWCLNCSDFENIRDNLEDYILSFVSSYSEHGGPRLDAATVRVHIFLTMLANFSQMMQAIPNCMKMFSLKDWESVRDRHDPRLAENIDGKSTFRSTLRQTENGVRMLEEMGADKVLEKWIQEVFVASWELQRKTPEMIFGS